MKSYAFNYKPKNQSFGQQFLYDGVHDFEYWKSQNPEANYGQYWGIRNAYVGRNFNTIESLTNDLSTAPLKDIANMAAGMSDNVRIAQTIASKKAWENVRDITNGTGTIMSLDLETIGDVTNVHRRPDGTRIINDYSGITEVGVHIRKYMDGIIQPDSETFTLAIGLDSKRADMVKEVIARYDNNRFEKLTETEQRLIETLSTYGHDSNIANVFTKAKIGALGGEEFTILTEATEKATPDPYNSRAVHMGFQHLRDMWGANDRVYAQNVSRIKNATVKLINDSIADPSTAMISANSAFEATQLNDWGINPKEFMDNSADIVYANTTIAKYQNTSVYRLQKKADLSHGVTGDKPANVENSAAAAGLDSAEFHHGGSDAKMQVDIATNKIFQNNKSYSQTAIESTDIDKPTTDYENSYFYLRNGQLDKNKLDHAVVDGKATQSYSIRGQYYRIDQEHSGYVPYTSMENGAEEEAVYALSMTDDNGTRFTKQFSTQQEAKTWLDNHSFAIKDDKYTKRRAAQRKSQAELTEMDWGRRMFDATLNPGDVNVTSQMEEINGFEGMKKYLSIVSEIDESEKPFEEVATSEFLNNKGLKSNYQQRAFRYTYNKIKSEEASLKEIVDYIDKNMPNANNTQKTVALRDIRKAYLEYVEDGLGEIPYTPKSGKIILSDALGIDIKVGDEYRRISGGSTSSILHDLDKVFSNSSQEEIQNSIKELGERQVLSDDTVKTLVKSIGDTTVPRNQYYSTVFTDIANELEKVTKPIVSYGNPITFFNSIENRGLTEEQITAINNKLHGTTIQEKILQNSQTRYSNGRKRGAVKSVTLSELRESLGENFDILGKIGANNIVEKANTISFDAGFDSLISDIGKSLNYTSEQTDDLLKGMFAAKDGKGNYKKYAINSREDVQSFIVPPSDSSTSAFVLLTNQQHSNKVAEALSTNVIENYISENNITNLSRQDIVNIFGDDASVLELKKINRTDIANLKNIFGDDAYNIIPILGKDTAQMTTINQGNTLEKFIMPSLNVYKDDRGIINGGILDAGDEYLSAYRRTGKDILDAVSNASTKEDFAKATQLMSRSQNEIAKNLSSPSSYRGYNGVRSANYNYNDILHGFYFDSTGILDTLKIQIKDIVNEGKIDNPLYQLVEMVGLATGDISEKTSDYLTVSQAENILNSAGFKELYAKNILTGNVLQDKTISERISNFSNIKKEAFNKNILGMMIDEMHSSESVYSKDFIATFERLQKAAPYMTQVLSETNVHNNIFSFVKPGEVIDFGLLNSSMRPTYQQVLNAIRFDPDKLDKNIMAKLTQGDVIVGPISRTAIEQYLLQTFGDKVISPSGKKYNEEERLITAPVKQMSDAELAIRYLDLDKEISNSADEKMQYAYDLFKKEYSSLYEGKFFQAPMLFNQEPFTSSDIKKIKLQSMQELQGNDTARTEILKNWVSAKWNQEKNDWVQTNKITYGDTLAEIKGHKILWDGPDTYLTASNIDDLIESGETTVIPAGRMVSDIKVMLQQEKGTSHSILIDDVFMKENPIFKDKSEALYYLQKIFDKVSGYDESVGYRPMYIANLSSFKHGTAIAPDSAFRIIAHEYQKAGELTTLQDKLRRMEYFKDWDFTAIDNKYLVSNQRNAKGADEAIHSLYDMVMNGTSDVDKRIQTVFHSLNQNNITFLETQRMLVNEVMGSKVMMDERMTQSIRLREMQGEFSTNRSFENIYIDTLKRDVANGYYEQGSMLKSSKGLGLDNIHSVMDEIAEDSINASKMRHYSKATKTQQRMISGITDSLMYYAGNFDVNEKNVLQVNIKDVLKNLPDKHITNQDLQDLIFYNNGKPSNFLKEIAGNKRVNATSIYLDFGTTFKGTSKDSIDFKGVLVPIFDIHTTVGEQPFFTNSQSGLVAFLNVYKQNINNKTANTEIPKAIENLYRSFAKEMGPFDKDSLLYKVAGKILLPNSAQSLAQDETAPLVDAMLTDNVIDSVRQEKEIRAQVANGDFSRIGELDEIVKKRNADLTNVAKRIREGDQSKELFELTGLSAIGEQYKGFEVVNGKKYFANAFEMNLANMKRHGVDAGVIGYQILEDAFYDASTGSMKEGKIALTKFESNARFDEYLLDNKGIQERIIKNLNQQGIQIDDGKELLRQLNKSITEGMSKSERTNFMNKVYSSVSFLGEEYLQDVGIISREVWRPPVFSAQIPGRIYLNNSVGNNQIRALTGGSTSSINNVDFDGDMYMMSFSLNGNGGLRTLEEDKALHQSYRNALKANNDIVAGLIESGEVFKKDNVNDIALYRLNQLKNYDGEELQKGITEWISNNDINVISTEDLTEGQILRAAHSPELRKAFQRHSSKGSMLTDENVMLASITARVRKDNIGSISTPNYKLRDTLLSIVDSVRNDLNISEEERRASFEILQDLTSISSSKLLEVSEQKSIDVKHVFDAVDLAQTPKWAKGMSILFGNKKDQGLYLMLEAINKSTFAFESKEELDKVFNTILSTERKDIRKGILNGQYSEAQQELILQFRALYDATNLEHAKDFQKYVLRNKNASTRTVANEIARLQELMNTGMFKNREIGSVMDDIISLITRTSLDSRFHGNVNDIYFNVGSVRKGQDIQTRAYMIDKIEKGNVLLREVSITDDGIEKGTRILLSEKGDTNYTQLNRLLDENYSVHVNTYSYLNGLSTEGTNNQIKRRKISRTLDDIILDESNESFNNFFALKDNATLKYGISEYGFVSGIIKRDSVDKARELFDDYTYYAKNNPGKGIDNRVSLIRKINEDIAQNYKPGQLYGLNDSDLWYADYAREYIKKNLRISDLELQNTHNDRIAIGSFDIAKYEAQKSFLNDNLYDIISSEKQLNESFDALQDIYSKALKDNVEDIPDDLKQIIANRDETISNAINNIRSLNSKTIKDTQDVIYGLFDGTDQMQAFFHWKDKPLNEAIVGFGEYLGTRFDQLNKSNIEDILSVNVSDEVLKSMAAKDKYALETTQKLLRQYTETHVVGDNVKGIVREKIHDSINVITENNEQVKYNFSADFINQAFSEATGSQSKMQHKKLSDIFSDVKMPKPKTIGIAIASLAALGVANNLLHNDKNKSPLSPEFANDHNDPEFKNNSMQNQQIAPPSKKTIYVDKPSGLQFKVSARTKNYISDVNNAKLIGMSNGGQANIYTQHDTSGVTDNWLANKFAELSN